MTESEKQQLKRKVTFFSLVESVGVVFLVTGLWWWSPALAMICLGLVIMCVGIVGTAVAK